MKRLLPLFMWLGCTASLWSQQIVTTIPTFIDPQDSLVIIVDLNQMDSSSVHVQNLKADARAGMDVFIWTWNPNEHPTGHPLVNGIGSQAWKNSNDALKMTALGNMQYQYVFKPSVISWYNTDTAQAYQRGLSFLVKPKDGGGYGDPDRKSDDINIPIPRPGLNADIVSHPNRFYFAGQTQQIALSGESPVAADLSFTVDGNPVASATNQTQLSHTLDMSALAAGRYEVVFTASHAGNSVSDTVYFLKRGSTPQAAIPSGRKEGVSYPTNSSAYLQLYAPGKDFVYLVGDFNGWLPDPNYELTFDPATNYFWIELTGLTPGEQYRFQYQIDSAGLRVTDPYIELILDEWNDQWIDSQTYPNLLPYPHGKTNDAVGVLEPGRTQYQWDNSINWQRPDQEDLICYEILIRDWDARHNFQSVIERLDYFEKLGINALKIMPVMEFEGNSSWGYNPMFMFALDKYYGTRDKFKELVEECHRRGIAVILDIVLNHQFGQSPLVRMYNQGGYNAPTPDNPWANPVAKHDFNVGYDLNHESAATRRWAKRVIRYWVEEYRVDGYRFDLSKGFTQNNTLGNTGAWGAYDQSRINILQDYASDIWSVDQGIYMILEHFADNSEEIELSSRGFMSWGNMNHEYNEGSMGYTSNLNAAMASSRGWPNNSLVAYAESHDEERIMYKNLQFGNSNGSYDIRQLPIALDRAELIAPFLIPLPGPKMLWKHGELGYDVSINDPCRTCEKAILWNYLNEPDRRDVFRSYQIMNKLKLEHPQMFRNDPTIRGLNQTLKFLKFENNGDHVLIYGNFGMSATNVQPFFPTTGWWYDLVSGDSLNVTDANMTINYAAGEYHVYTNQRWFIPADLPISVEEELIAQAGKGITVGPNPFEGEVYFYMADGWDVNRVQLTVTNILGQEVYSGNLEVQDARFTWRAQDDLKRGQLYIYRIEANDQVYTGRLIRKP